MTVVCVICFYGLFCTYIFVLSLISYSAFLFGVIKLDEGGKIVLASFLPIDTK